MTIESPHSEKARHKIVGYRRVFKSEQKKKRESPENIGPNLCQRMFKNPEFAAWVMYDLRLPRNDGQRMVQTVYDQVHQ